MDNLYIGLFLLVCFVMVIMFIWLLIGLFHESLPASVTCDLLNYHSEIEDVNYDDLDADKTSDIIGRCVKCKRLIEVGPDGTWIKVSAELEKAWLKDLKEEQKE